VKKDLTVSVEPGSTFGARGALSGASPPLRVRLVTTRPALTRLLGALLAAALIGAAAPAAADGLLDEVWAGGYAHDFADSQHKETGTAEIEFEADTVQPRFLHFIGWPHIALTAAFNTGGDTSFGGVALVWQRRLISRLSGTVQFGLNVNNGIVRVPPGPAGEQLYDERLIVGSNLLFREAVGLDWSLSRNWRLGAQYIHESNGQILSHGPNEGLNELGLRLGYRIQ